MTKPRSRPASEALSAYTSAAGVAMLAIALVLSLVDKGTTPAIMGVALLVLSQLLHPFWKPKWKPEPPPPGPTLADSGIAGLAKGERWRAKEAARVEVAVHWAPMGNFAHEAQLPAGTLVLIDYAHAPGSTFVALMPADATALEPSFVAEHYRSSSKYQGYSLTVEPAEFAAKFVRF